MKRRFWSMLRLRPGVGGTLREVINENPRAFIFCVLTLVFISGIMVVRSIQEANYIPPPPKTWFYDLSNGQLFAADARAVPPIKGPTGQGVTESGIPSGVRAHVFACEDCTDLSDRFVGFIEIYAPKANQSKTEVVLADPELKPVIDTDPDGLKQWRGGSLIRRPEDHESMWVSVSSPQAGAILRDLKRRCGGTEPLHCRPEDELYN